ncbi:hypothetical protein D3C83_02660 [compost metagenome]
MASARARSSASSAPAVRTARQSDSAPLNCPASVRAAACQMRAPAASPASPPSASAAAAANAASASRARPRSSRCRPRSPATVPAAASARRRSSAAMTSRSSRSAAACRPARTNSVAREARERCLATSSGMGAGGGRRNAGSPYAARASRTTDALPHRSVPVALLTVSSTCGRLEWPAASVKAARATSVATAGPAISARARSRSSSRSAGRRRM